MPDCVRETFEDTCELEGEDGGTRSLRCMMSTHDPDPSDATYQVDFTFLLRDGAAVKAVHDRHIEGIFSRAQWVTTLAQAGFRVENLAREGEELFLCRRLGPR